MTIAKNAASAGRKQRASPPRDPLSTQSLPQSTISPRASALQPVLSPRADQATSSLIRPSSPNAPIPTPITAPPLSSGTGTESSSSAVRSPPQNSPLGAGGEVEGCGGGGRLHNSDDEGDPRVQASGYARIVEGVLSGREQRAREQGSLMHDEETEGSTFDMPLVETDENSNQGSEQRHLSWDELDIMFEEELWQQRGLVIRPMGEDGACLFRAVADQVYGDQECHNLVRQHCCDYLTKNKEYYGSYLTSGEEIVSYIRRKRLPRIHGNHLEVQAMCEMYNRPFEVYEYSCLPLKCVSMRNENTTRNPIRISYHRKCHFNSLYDPHASPRLGIGLGLSKTFRSPHSLQNELKKREKEISKLETNMMNDKLLETDIEISEKELLKQALQESRQLAYQEAATGGPSRKRTATSQQSTSKTSLKRAKPEKDADIASSTAAASSRNEDIACCSKTLDTKGHQNLQQPATTFSSTSKATSRSGSTNLEPSGVGGFCVSSKSSGNLEGDLGSMGLSGSGIGEEDDGDVLQHILQLSKHEF